ncbi:sulfatase [Halorientalis regularis]|uniref:Arylsulfatase A n=1 Tax=Halorientalis regularis TaxID=660518 RepID=A0A1G7HGR6_9EURY|nr:sulfatase [Halorientalis regularis]SDE99588.1 Arylsulfatase A [Halorientalis regularis]
MDSVLLITVDCLRADHVGCYGYDRPTTPHIDAFVDDATWFEVSYANCPGTRWTLQTIHTGLYTNQIDGLGIPEAVPTLAELFREAGYATAGFANNGYLSRDYGYDIGFDTYLSVSDFADEQGIVESLARGVDNLIGAGWLRERLSKLYRLFERVAGSEFQPSVTDVDVVDHAVDWLDEQRRAENDHFAWIHLMDAHTPYARWDDHLKALRGDVDVEHVIHPGRSDAITVGEAPPQAVIDAYDAGIRSADEQIGRLLNHAPDDATVILTGDHGEEFGQFEEFHIATLHSSYTQVPTIVRSAELDSGVVRDGIAEHVDVFPTVLNGHVPEYPDRPGTSLPEKDRNLEAPVFFQHDGSYYGVRRGEWKLLTDTAAEETELYHGPHMSTDGANVIGDEPEIAAELRTLLDDHAATGTAARTDKRGHEGLRDSVEENLEDLGYIE